MSPPLVVTFDENSFRSETVPQRLYSVELTNSLINDHNKFIMTCTSAIFPPLRVFRCGRGVSDFDASQGKYNIIILLSCGHFRRIFTPVKIHRTAVISAARFESTLYTSHGITYNVTLVECISSPPP